MHDKQRKYPTISTITLGSGTLFVMQVKPNSTNGITISLYPFQLATHCPHRTPVRQLGPWRTRLHSGPGGPLLAESLLEEWEGELGNDLSCRVVSFCSHGSNQTSCELLVAPVPLVSRLCGMTTKTAHFCYTNQSRGEGELKHTLRCITKRCNQSPGWGHLFISRKRILAYYP